MTLRGVKETLKTYQFILGILIGGFMWGLFNVFVLKTDVNVLSFFALVLIVAAVTQNTDGTLSKAANFKEIN